MGLLRSKAAGLTALLATLAFGSFSLGSCNRSTVYYKYIHVGREGWRQTDTLVIESEVRDSDMVGRVFLEARHTAAYPYTNFAVAVSALSLDSVEAFPKREVVIDMADSTGRWTGRDYNGLFANSTEAGSMRITKAGIYRFKVWSIMADSLLPGIADVGIRIDNFADSQRR